MKERILLFAMLIFFTVAVNAQVSATDSVAAGPKAAKKAAVIAGKKEAGAKAAKKEASEFLKEEEKQDKEAVDGMEKAIQVIRDSERKSAEEAINALYAKLLADKRFEDLERATKDEEFRKQLFEEYK